MTTTEHPLVAPTPGELYAAATALRRHAQAAATAADKVAQLALAAEREARYRLALSVPCPFCHAWPANDCKADLGVSLHRMPRVHGMRHDAAKEA